MNANSSYNEADSTDVTKKQLITDLENVMVNAEALILIFQQVPGMPADKSRGQPYQTGASKVRA